MKDIIIDALAHIVFIALLFGPAVALDAKKSGRTFKEELFCHDEDE